MATKKTNTKNNRLTGGLLRGKPILTNVALAFAVVFAGVGGYVIHGTSFASSPEIKSNLAGGYCLDDWNGTLGSNQPGGEAAVNLYKCVGDTNQRFAFSGSQIRLNGLAQCLDVKGRSTANGATVGLYPCNGQSNQSWRYSGGEIIGSQSNKCLDVPGGNAYNGQRLEIWSCGGGTNQKWTLDSYGGGTGGGGGYSCKGTYGWNNYDTAPASYCALAAKWVAYYGYTGFNTQPQLTCASSVFNGESAWRVDAANPSGAYGIPQALPGSKMGIFGADWATNPDVQIRWGIYYMKSTYGSPCNAWSHWKIYRTY